MKKTATAVRIPVMAKEAEQSFRTRANSYRSEATLFLKTSQKFCPKSI